MTVTIVSAAACVDTDTGSYFELATRAGAACLRTAGIGVDQIHIVVNIGVYRDHNIVEPAVAALLQKRLGIGLDYRTGRTPAFAFDLMNGGTGLMPALLSTQCLLGSGTLDYALVLAGDCHPSTERLVAGFPYATTSAALLLRTNSEAGGFGHPHTSEPVAAVQPTAWLDLKEAGAHGRSSGTWRTGGGDPVSAAAEVVQKCLADEGLDRTDLIDRRAVLLAPAPVPGFADLLAARLDVPAAAIAGLDPALGDPHTAAPVHAYLAAAEAGRLDTADTVIFLAADDTCAAAMAYRPR
ncbi:hypothetical protein F3087_34480 [Nocardia colli]|uniref:Beta-ketoacyl-[acyl-carrier-protein] synthase III N-terminal domain-containing protein n=1 Tax=Nocardia colli TaxID=2545717 RepID=A0A5N0E837_9NOCA|nr:hypothetical protein [Nocardia colli]KAA8884325.1 hypothetical protein F3087_34480 [Nocardia colli]